MDINRFDYPLPKELIAQYPVTRGEERLLVLERRSGSVEHRCFQDLARYLGPDDLLVLNDTRVLPARLLGKKTTGGQAEVLLIKSLGQGRWSCFVKASKPARPGTVIFFPGGLDARVEGRQGELFEVEFSDPDKVLKVGQIPLPPYIGRPPENMDEKLYQTVYARNMGSVAAPTAGLHFTDGFLHELASRGVASVFVTLHVGPGTFQPVRVQNIEEHTMHAEEFFVSEETATAIEEARKNGKRIVAVGTTTTRVLEHLMTQKGRIAAGQGSTDIFIYEGFKFRCVDALLTNFHLPCSTLIMLVSAFGGHDSIMNAYRSAVDERYRFFSYGDAMFIV